MMAANAQKPYRFGFVLTTAAGNMTRYLNLRKYAGRDPEVECVWAPVSHYLDPDPYRRLPGKIHSRVVVRIQSAPVMRQLNRLDAVMYHVFEPYVSAVLRRRLRSRPLVVWSYDHPPSPEPSAYGGSHARTSARARLRFRFDRWCARHTDLFLPFSPWVGEKLVQDCGVSPGRVHPINVGLDLELWPYAENRQQATGNCEIPTPRTLHPTPPARRPQILFVGGNFARKGGDLLLDVYRRHFADKADLHLVTQEPPTDLPPGVSLYSDLSPNDARMRALYARSDLFVLPTNADMSPWVVVEAMATGLPVITTRVGGIPDMVTDGKTGFLIERGDGSALADRVRTLLADPSLRRCLGAEGRAVVERDFNAAVCVPRLLNVMKRAVDAAR
jgi:glycosyltransferase involved in cell wall biosynthesis